MLSKKDATIILKQYSLLGRQCYIDAIIKINELNDFILNGELFCNPLTYEVMFPVLKNDPDYKGVEFDAIDVKVNQYPVELSEFVKVWHSLSNSFKRVTILNNWAGGISKVVEDVIYKQFDSQMIMNDLKENKLNPFIIKLLEICRLRMETQLAEKYSDTLEIYLRILIRFVARDSEFFDNNEQYEEQGMGKYDESIHFDKPMVKTVVKIKKFKEKDESGSKFLLYTKPSLINI